MHSLMMFQGKIKELCQDIHNLLGNKKIIEYFLKDVEYKNASFLKMNPILSIRSIQLYLGTGEIILYRLMYLKKQIMIP